MPEDQTDTIAFLRTIAGAPPVETHISLVFLGTDTVWKLKKAVRLSFLDFSTLDARRHVCERELALNTPAAPGLYRDVVPIVRHPNGTLAIGPAEGAVIVEWVLRMARIPAGDFLEARAAAGQIDPPLLDGMADAVAAYHARLPALPDAVPAMRHVLAGNVQAALSAGLPRDAVLTWDRLMRDEVGQLLPWLAQRAREGFVRRAHGDLHLGNLCLWHGKPVPFDALEFDEALATIDLGYDLAFLLMDLDHRVSRAAANRVLNRYVARNGDAALVRGLPAFLSLRAMVRAHVAARSGRDAEAHAYLEAAAAYLRPAPPVIVAIGGLPGSGKSTLARGLAPDLGRAPGALILRSDEIRKRQFGLAPEERLPKSAYTPDASRAVFEELASSVRLAAEAGQAVIADATFMSAGHRAMIATAARQAGVAWHGFWLDAPLAVLEQRVAARRGDASDADVAVLLAAAKNDPGAGDWTRIDATDSVVALACIRKTLTDAGQLC